MREFKKGAFTRHPLAYLVEAADDICYAIIDLEDSVDQKIIDVKAAIKLLEPIAEMGGADLSKRYEGKERAGWLRAYSIHALQQKCWDVFEGSLSDIVAGKFSKSLIDESEAKDLYENVKNEVKATAYSDARVLQIEAGRGSR